MLPTLLARGELFVLGLYVLASWSPEKTIMILPPQCSVIYVGKLHWAPAESVERL